jgi:hypothetical protein
MSLPICTSDQDPREMTWSIDCTRTPGNRRNQAALMIERLVFTVSSLLLTGLGRIEARRDSGVYDLQKREHLFTSEQVLSFLYLFISLVAFLTYVFPRLIW